MNIQETTLKLFRFSAVRRQYRAPSVKRAHFGFVRTTALASTRKTPAKSSILDTTPSASGHPTWQPL